MWDQYVPGQAVTPQKQGSVEQAFQLTQLRSVSYSMYDEHL